MSTLVARMRARLRGDGGFTLVEMLVATLIFSLLTGTMLMAVLASARSATAGRELNNLNEEARLVLNRMSRELREARRVVAVTNPDGTTFNATGDVALTFEVDFDGDGTIDPSAADPEQLTYLYDYAGQRLMLQASGASLPVLAGNVSQFKVTYHSRRFEYNGTLPASGSSCGATTGTKDAVVTWEEVDGHPGRAHGNCNGLLDQELDVVDSVTIDLRVLYGARQQVYRTRIDLRNRPA